MNRLTIGLFVAAAAGALGWWSSQRNNQARQDTARLAVNLPNARANAGSDPGMIKTPPNVDPNMIRTMPNVDPKMAISPPAMPSNDPKIAINPPAMAARDPRIVVNDEAAAPPKQDQP